MVPRSLALAFIFDTNVLYIVAITQKPSVSSVTFYRVKNDAPGDKNLAMAYGLVLGYKWCPWTLKTTKTINVGTFSEPSRSSNSPKTPAADRCVMCRDRSSVVE